MSKNKTFTLLALLVFLGGTFALGFSNAGFSSLLAQTVKYTNIGPTNLTATLQDSPGPRIYFTWQDNSSNETGFLITQSGPNTSSSFATIKAVSANQTSTYHSVATTTPGTYYYLVKAIVSQAPTGTIVADSNMVSVLLQATTTTVVAPSNLIASSTSSTIYLSWIDNSNNETGFLVEQSGRNTTSSFFVIASTTPNTTFYSQPFTATGTWTFRVRAVSSGLFSGYSNTASITR